MNTESSLFIMRRKLLLWCQGNLKELTKLVVQYNQLTALPRAIGYDMPFLYLSAIILLVN